MIEKISDFINSKDGVLTFRTGGTTLNEKFVEKSVQNMKEECKDIYEALNLGNDDLVFISTTTPKHIFGYTYHYIFPLLYGYRIIEERINYPEDIKFENAVLITTPSFLESMRKYNETPPVKPKVIIAAGAELQEKTFKYAQTISERVIEIYGSTETGTIAYRENPEDKMKLLNGIKILEAGENYTKIDTKYSVKSPIIIEDRIKLSGREIEFGSRCGQVLKIQEKRIVSSDMEREIINSGFVRACRCFEYKGKLAVIVEVNKNGINYLISNDKLSFTKLLKEKLRRKFEIVPQKWKFTDEIPTKENGKTDRGAIKDLFKLNLSLPLVIERECKRDCASFKLCFLNNSNFFKGHFDGFPILPGVVQLFWAAYFTKVAFKLDCNAGQIRKIKFSNIIRPAVIVDLNIEKLPNGINYTYSDEHKTYSSGLLPLKNIYEEE